MINETAKKNRNRLSAKKTAEISETIKQLSGEGHPLEVIARKCGLTMDQVTRMWASLIQSQQLQLTAPKYHIYNSSVSLSKILADCGLDLSTVKIVVNSDKSLTLTLWTED